MHGSSERLSVHSIFKFWRGLKAVHCSGLQLSCLGDPNREPSTDTNRLCNNRTDNTSKNIVHDMMIPVVALRAGFTSGVLSAKASV